VRRDHDGARGNLIGSGAPLQVTFEPLSHARPFRVWSTPVAHADANEAIEIFCGRFYFWNSGDFARVEAINGTIHISQSETKI
jgi:hypothetical protein